MRSAPIREQLPAAARRFLTNAHTELIYNPYAIGYVDLGEVGLAERWRDLAVATWSVTWNLGPGHEGLFLDAYGADWGSRAA